MGRRIVEGAVALALAGGLAGCGGGDGGTGEPAPAGRDLTAVMCPLQASGEPAEGAFDTAQLVGAPLQDAEATAAGHGCRVVVAMEDGAGMPVPTDVDPTRIYVYTEDGVVTEIEGVGGGI